jgi:putative DNA primase/helicase
MTDYATIIEEYTKPSAPGAVLRRMSDIEPQRLSWLWPGRIPLGKMTLFAGDPGLGKSFVTLDIVARVTRGTQWPDGARNEAAGNVILLSAEDDPSDTIRPRLEAAGADLDKVHILEAVRHVKPNGESSLDHFSLQTDITALQDAAVSRDVRLIVIDPISAYLGSTDSHVNAKVRGLLAPLTALAQSLRFALVIVDHLSKSNRPALYRPNGSIGFTAAARAVWFFAKDPDASEQRLMLPGKLNLAPEQTGLGYALKENEPGTVVVEWGAAVTMTADSVLQPEAAEERSERLEAADWLREQLAAGPVGAKQLKKDATAAGLSWITVRRAQGLLGIKPAKNGMEGGWSWQLPTPEGAHQPPKMLTVLEGAPSPQVSTFAKSVIPDEASYTPDPDGPGCACKACGSHFGTVAGWKYHILCKRCVAAAEAAD